jgi:hypothetical protein
MLKVFFEVSKSSVFYDKPSNTHDKVGSNEITFLVMEELIDYNFDFNKI